MELPVTKQMVTFNDVPIVSIQLLPACSQNFTQILSKMYLQTLHHIKVLLMIYCSRSATGAAHLQHNFSFLAYNLKHLHL